MKWLLPLIAVAFLAACVPMPFPHHDGGFHEFHSIHHPDFRPHRR